MSRKIAEFISIKTITPTSNHGVIQRVVNGTPKSGCHGVRRENEGRGASKEGIVLVGKTQDQISEGRSSSNRCGFFVFSRDPGIVDPGADGGE